MIRTQGFASGHRAPLMRAYKTSDGRFIQLMLLAPDKPWPELCAMIGQPELATDPRFATNPLRIENGAELCAILDSAFRARSWAEWAPLFLAWNAPWELISNLEELGNDPQLAAAGTVFKMQLKNGEIVDVVAGPIGFDEQSRPEQPGRLARSWRAQRRGAGQHWFQSPNCRGCGLQWLTRVQNVDSIALHFMCYTVTHGKSLRTV